MHSATYDYLQGLADDEQRLLEPQDCVSPQVAFKTLLRGRTVYGETTAGENLAPYGAAPVSLPLDVSNTTDVYELVDTVGQEFLAREGERMLRPQAEVDTDEVLKSLRPHSDPKLIGHRRRYAAFLRDLDGRHMLDWTTQPRERVGVFFVYKKEKLSLRMILDARRSNRHFRRAPHVSLVTGEGLSSIEVDLADPRSVSGEAWDDLHRAGTVTFGISDIKDAFHRLRLPLWTRPFFCLPPVAAGDVGLEGQSVGGVVLEKHSLVSPMPVSFPMGFTWSLWFCQHIAERLAASTPSLTTRRILRDRGEPLVITNSSAWLVVSGISTFTSAWLSL